MAAVTVGATFLLPKLHRPGELAEHPEHPDEDGEGTPGQSLPEGA
jgi:hypothetical protein